MPAVPVHPPSADPPARRRPTRGHRQPRSRRYTTCGSATHSGPAGGDKFAGRLEDSRRAHPAGPTGIGGQRGHAPDSQRQDPRDPVREPDAVQPCCSSSCSARPPTCRIFEYRGPDRRAVDDLEGQHVLHDDKSGRPLPGGAVTDVRPDVAPEPAQRAGRRRARPDPRGHCCARGRVARRRWFDRVHREADARLADDHFVVADQEPSRSRATTRTSPS